MNTPRTDQAPKIDYRDAVWGELVPSSFARQLERELANCQADRNRIYSQLNTLLATMQAGSVPEYVIHDIKNPPQP